MVPQLPKEVDFMNSPMIHNRRLFLAFAAASATAAAAMDKTDRAGIVRAAVIGGMTMTRIWQEIAGMFETETEQKMGIVVTGQRPQLAEAMRAGKVDLLTMHSGANFALTASPTMAG